jgi:hypothetical protein
VKLYVSARRRLTRHRALVHDAHTGPGRDDREARIAFVTIEMLNLWTNFMRSYYLSCMYSAVSRRGIYIKAQGARQTENQALGFAVRYWRPRATPQANGSWQSRDEPTWHDPNHLIPIMRAQGLSNLADFEAAFSTGERTFLDLPVFRNYFGHRNGRSQIAAQNLGPYYGIAATRRPTDILLSRPLRRHQPLILDCMDHIGFTIEYLCT